MATGRIGTTPVLTTRWSKQPAGGTTVLSGLDDNSVSLVYSVGYEQVYRNGTLLSRGNDYTATNGTTITLVDATLAGDVIEVFANAVVPLTDTYSQTVANSLFVNQSTFDAKGDLIAGTGDNAYSKLTVGSNGDTLVADSSTATGLRYNPQNALANPVINGGMDIWQRGTSAAITAATTSFFGPDRWALYRGVSGSTYSRQTVSDTTNLPNIQYALRIQRDSGNTSTANINALQNFETVNSIPFVGKTVTLSFYARRGANYSAASNVLAVWLRQGTGTDQNFYNDYTNVSNVTNTDVTLTTSWQRFALTGTVATNTTELAVQFQINPTGTAGAADWAEITGVQIDLGTYTASSAPTFRRSGGTLAGELDACLRYYWKVADATITGNANIMNAISLTTTDVRGVIQFPVPMRVAPTLSHTTGTGYYYYQAAAGDGFNSFLVNQPTTVNAMLYAGSGQGVGGLTAGQAGIVFTDRTEANLAFSAEL